jgi:acyl-CoA thioester hydrolase
VSEFSTRVKVRHYECDSLGHLNHAVYHSYGEVARLEWFDQAGGGAGFGPAKVAPVLLETHVRFRRELLAGDVVDITCEMKMGDGKVFEMISEIRKLDGTVAAEIESVLGIIDLRRRKLVDDPRAAFERAGIAIP